MKRIEQILQELELFRLETLSEWMSSPKDKKEGSDQRLSTVLDNVLKFNLQTSQYRWTETHYSQMSAFNQKFS